MVAQVWVRPRAQAMGVSTRTVDALLFGVANIPLMFAAYFEPQHLDKVR